MGTFPHYYKTVPPLQHWRPHTTAGVGRGLTEKRSPPPSACCLVMGGGGDWKKLCISEGRGFGDVLLDGYPPLLEVSPAYIYMHESPRDEGERNVGILTAPLPTPWRNGICIMEGFVAVLLWLWPLSLVPSHLSPSACPPPPPSPSPDRTDLEAWKLLQLAKR